MYCLLSFGTYGVSGLVLSIILGQRHGYDRLFYRIHKMDSTKKNIEMLQQLKTAGFRIALDDFGTGYSSLTYMRQLPVSKVKVDRSFVRDMIDNNEDRALVETIVAMAHTLGREVVAEGLETLEHGVPLLRCGCDYGQGYGIARPMPPSDLAAWATRWRMPRVWKDAAPRSPAVPDYRS